MGQEIERKFLVKRDFWQQQEKSGQIYRQGYLNSAKERTVRVRLIGDRGILTIKGEAQGLTRPEYEYDLPLEEAQELLKLCEQPLIEKKRYKIKQGDLTWEVDEFFGENEGLIIAEVELEHEQQGFEYPAWLDQEVTGDPRYFNANLVRQPYRSWPAEAK
ncbi:MAG TPA: CYTH domain-containing protein [Anaerolineae bacterium]|nr:CYTH domain-containing protein [Anaerolineae bacterium]HMR65452.1 CYTH domain-containing protein [Anaerolineae bacterium]